MAIAFLIDMNKRHFGFFEIIQQFYSVKDRPNIVPRNDPWEGLVNSTFDRTIDYCHSTFLQSADSSHSGAARFHRYRSHCNDLRKKSRRGIKIPVSVVRRMFRQVGYYGFQGRGMPQLCRLAAKSRQRIQGLHPPEISSLKPKPVISDDHSSRRDLAWNRHNFEREPPEISCSGQGSSNELVMKPFPNNQSHC